MSYAKLTRAGRRKLNDAAITHVAGVEELFTSRFSDEELETLADLLSRLPLSGRDGVRSCSPSTE